MTVLASSVWSGMVSLKRRHFCWEKLEKLFWGLSATALGYCLSCQPQSHYLCIYRYTQLSFFNFVVLGLGSSIGLDPWECTELFTCLLFLDDSERNLCLRNWHRGKVVIWSGLQASSRKVNRRMRITSFRSCLDGCFPEQAVLVGLERDSGFPFPGLLSWYAS